MAGASEWSVVFYQENDRDPVGEFLGSLDTKTQVRFAWSIEQLRLRNVQAREPLAKHVEGKLWELREESRTNIYRLFYFLASGRRIVFLHGFQKKTERIPRREIEIARRRMEQFAAEGGES